MCVTRRSKEDGTITSSGYGNEFNIRRKVFVMLFGINEHQIHHRAQVGAYLHFLTGQRASPYPL